MSEGKKSSGSPKKSKKGAGKKGKKSSTTKKSKSEGQSNSKENRDYDTKPTYEPGNSQSKGGSAYESKTTKTYASKRKKKTSKGPEKEGGLEKKVSKGEAEQVEVLVKEFVKKGLSEDDARVLVAEIVSSIRQERSHDWTNSSKYFERIKAYARNSSLKDLVKGTWYLFLALTDITPEEDKDPYKAIDDGASIIYLPGWLSVAKNKGPLEKALGKKVAYVNSTDIDEVHRVIRYAAEKHGRVQVVGFSDGGKVIEDYISKYSDRIVDHFYSVASNPFVSKSPRVTHIIGDRDKLAALETSYTWHDEGYKGPSAHEVYGGHSYFCYDKQTLKEVAGIINSSEPTRAYYTIRQTPDSSLEMRLAS